MAKPQRSPGLLSPEQIAFYDAFGFVVLPQALSNDEMKIIERDFETLMLERRDGEPFNGQERQGVEFLIEHRSDFKRFMPRIGDIAEQLLGPGYIHVGTDANLYVADTGWHADLGWHPSMLGGRKPPPPSNFYRGLKVAMYLDPVARGSGCLRVIPISHITPNTTLDVLVPIHSSVPHNFSPDGTIKQFGIPPCEVPCHAIESNPGDLVVFNNQTWHASFGGETGRRMIAINYKAKPNTYEEHLYVRDRGKQQRKAQENLT